MKIRKVLLLLLLPFFAEFAMSCHECEPTKYGKYSFNNVSLKNHMYTRDSIIYNVDSAANFTYVMEVHVNRIKLASLQQKQFGFTQTAMALSYKTCITDDLSPKDSIISIQVIAENQFDQLHPAGSDISDYFTVGHQSSIDQYLHNEMARRVQVEEGQESLAPEYFMLFLNNKPSINGLYRLKLVIKLSDGSIVEQSTQVNLY